MKQLVAIALCFSSFVAAVQGCGEGVLVVGGEGAQGPLQELHLLTNTGWCQNIDLPKLPEPLVQPSVLLADYSIFSNISPEVKEYVIVCGFATETVCRYAGPGDAEWKPMPGAPTPNPPSPAHEHTYPPQPFVSNRQNLAMVMDKEVGRVHMLVTNTNSSFQGSFMSAEASPETPSAWKLQEPSDIQLESYTGPWLPNVYAKKNLTGACMLKTKPVMSDFYSGDEYLIIGGRFEDSKTPYYDSFWAGSDSAVGRMSFQGGSNCSSCSPSWENRVTRDMLEKRDDMGCLPFQDPNIPSGAIVAGGLDYGLRWGKSGASSHGQDEVYETHRSTEFFNNTYWYYGPDLNEARAGAPLVNFCQNIMILGGKQQSGRYSLWEDYYPPNSSWIGTETDTVQTVYLDTVEKLVGDRYSQYTWSRTDIKLPVRMSNFGVAQIPDAGLFCKDGGFLCDHDGLFPAGDCSDHFWQCSNGEAFDKTCDPGLVFNPSIGMCDWPFNVEACA